MKKTFSTPLIPISWGELIDKITILEIKQTHIKSPTALTNINKELGYLKDILQNNTGVAELIKVFNQLLHCSTTKHDRHFWWLSFGS